MRRYMIKKDILKDCPFVSLIFFRIEKMPYDGPGGQYIAGSPDGSRPGVFQANVIRPADK